MPLSAILGLAAATAGCTFVSRVHVVPAPGSEQRGFHFVTTAPPTGSIPTPRVAWAAGIRGELCSLNISDVSVPQLLYNRQNPGPLSPLYQSRTLMWLPATTLGTSAPLMVLANRGMDLIDTSAPTAPITMANVSFFGAGRGANGKGDNGINGLVWLRDGQSSAIVIGAGMNGSLPVARFTRQSSTEITATSLGLFYKVPPVYDLDVYVSPSVGTLLCTVSPRSGRLLTLLLPTGSRGNTVRPPAEWTLYLTMDTPAGWPASTGCNRVRVHPLGVAFISCFSPQLNEVLVIDIAGADDPHIIKTFPFSDEQPTGMLLERNVLFVAGGRDVMMFNVTDPRNSSVMSTCGSPCQKIMISKGQNAHSLAYYYDVSSRAHLLVLTAQIDNNLGVVQITDPGVVALLDIQNHL